jgi:DNA primase large subunit
MASAVADYLEVSRNTLLAKLGPTAGQTLYEQRRKDHISHFLLRLAFCRSEELRLWFIRHECTLFKYRYSKEDPNDREKFLKSVELDATPTSVDKMLVDFYPQADDKGASKKSRLLADITATYSMDAELAKNAVFYKVPFEQVLELVSKRAVILRDGFAYVPESERILLVMNVFRMKLTRALEETARMLPRLEEDDRYFLSFMTLV